MITLTMPEWCVILLAIVIYLNLAISVIKLVYEYKFAKTKEDRK